MPLMTYRVTIVRLITVAMRFEQVAISSVYRGTRVHFALLSLDGHGGDRVAIDSCQRHQNGMDLGKIEDC
eukprot:870185-Amorphochlora_amoeboformis.AAC.1